MKTFRDNAGREWEIAVNAATVKRVRALLQFDLVATKNVYEQLVADPALLVDVVFVLCQRQAEAQGVTDEQFGQAMAGDAIDAATRALLEERIAFFPNARDRARAKKALEKIEGWIETAQDVMEKTLDDPATDAKMKALIATRFNSALNSPELSASNPGDSPSEN